MNQIPDRLAAVRQRIAHAAVGCGRDPSEITLLAVSKTKPLRDVLAAIGAGQREFGENYLQDALPKIEALTAAAVVWHFIGRLQSNKTAEISRWFDWVHGLDSLKHAERLSRQRPDERGPLQVCLQVNLSGEASKGGVGTRELAGLAEAVAQLPNLTLRGLMTMPDPGYDADRTRAAFDELADLRTALIARGLGMDTLSMGMSGDLEIAIAAGSTLVRVGTDIFGRR